MTSRFPQAGDDSDRSIAGQIAEALAQRVISGALPPGAALRQDHVATEFGTSHVPVREAFRRLEARGLAVSLPRRGVRVAPLDPRSLLEVTEMRAALEVVALRHAFARLQPCHLRNAEDALTAGEASDDILVWEACNRRFHRTIVVPCGMPRLLASVDSLHEASARFLFATWRDLAWQPRSETEHRLILKALAGGALEEGAALLERHIKAAGAALAERLS